MRKPRTPPSFSELFDEAMRDDRLEAIFREAARPCVDGKYLHWHKLRHYELPGNLSHREWWLSVKMSRKASARQTPLEDGAGMPFSYSPVDPIPERLHWVDLHAGGRIQMPEQITSPEGKDRYYIGSLIEEAITSSQLEGAATTRLVAKQMIRSNRRPSDRSERMILNNFLTMKRLAQWKNEPLTTRLVLDIHRLVTTDTLDDPSAVGRFRAPSESITIGDDYGETFHVPPPADQLEQRMEAMCDFANEKGSGSFIHPILRSIILHFWLAHDHPFVDGNGRTARALFYWSMLRHGYWLCEYISISSIIHKGPSKYGRAFLYTESDDNDLTYFILYHLDVLRRAIDELHKYLKRKADQLQLAESKMRVIALLNHRQRALVAHALRHAGYRYTIKSHGVSHNVAHQTARTDLHGLSEMGLLNRQKIGKTWYFTPADDIEARLAELQ